MQIVDAIRQLCSLVGDVDEALRDLVALCVGFIKHALCKLSDKVSTGHNVLCELFVLCVRTVCEKLRR